MPLNNVSAPQGRYLHHIINLLNNDKTIHLIFLSLKIDSITASYWCNNKLKEYVRLKKYDIAAGWYSHVKVLVLDDIFYPLILVCIYELPSAFLHKYIKLTQIIQKQGDQTFLKKIQIQMPFWIIYIKFANGSYYMSCIICRHQSDRVAFVCMAVPQIVNWL